MVSGDRHIHRSSKEYVLSLTITENVTVSRSVVAEVTLQLLNFVMIH